MFQIDNQIIVCFRFFFLILKLTLILDLKTTGRGREWQMLVAGDDNLNTYSVSGEHNSSNIVTLFHQIHQFLETWYNSDARIVCCPASLLFSVKCEERGWGPGIEEWGDSSRLQSTSEQTVKLPFKSYPTFVKTTQTKHSLVMRLNVVFYLQGVHKKTLFHFRG